MTTFAIVALLLFAALMVLGIHFLRAGIAALIGALLITAFLVGGCSTVKGATSVVRTNTKTWCLLNPLKECDKCTCCTATNDRCCCRHVDKCSCDPTAKDGKCCEIARK